MKSKTLLPIVSLLLAVGALVSCGPKVDPVPPESEGKIIIKVGTYNGGVGTAWIKQLGDMFNAQFPDYTDPTAPDKKGVYFDIDANANYEGSSLKSGLALDMYFTENVEYTTMARGGMFLDISDSVTSELTDCGDTGTIKDKLDPILDSYLKVINDKYYGLPFYDGFYNTMFDVDLFTENNWYFDKNGEIGVNPKDNADNLFVGSDGKEGTYDDGLPATFEQFGTLMDNMAGSVYPYIVAGNAVQYLDMYIRNIFANFEGYDQAALNYTFNGTATNLIKVDNNGNITPEPEATITEYKDGPILQKQAGKYYALKFLKDYIFGENRLNPDYSKLEHITAERVFVNTIYAAGDKKKTAGFLVDGSWWENEAIDVLNEDEELHPSTGGKMKRRFGIMPIPKISDDLIGEKQTIMSLNGSFGFVNANTQHPDLCKKIMKFFHTNKCLSKFNSMTSMTRPFNYTVSDADKANMTYFGKTLFEMKSSSNIVYPYSSAQGVLNKPGYFNERIFPWAIGANSHSPHISLLSNDTSVNTAEGYFNALYTYAESSWNK